LEALGAGRLKGEPIEMELTDLMWAGGDWMKFRFMTIERSREPNSQYIRRYVVDIHYMYNLRTRTWDDIKFKNSPDVGCVGRTELADATSGGQLVGFSCYGPGLTFIVEGYTSQACGESGWCGARTTVYDQMTILGEPQTCSYGLDSSGSLFP
jgi:hypothetical protein